MSTITSRTPPPCWHENPHAAPFNPLRRPRWCALAIGACLVVLGATGCGGSSGTSSSSVPKLTRAPDGSYVGHVKDASAANAACDKKNQPALGQALKKLGAGKATITPGALGTPIQNATGIVAVVFQYGQPTGSGQVQETVCMVRVPK